MITAATLRAQASEITVLPEAAPVNIVAMALTVGVSEARASLAEILDRVEEGDEITITRNGRAVAVVIRPDRLRFRRGEPILEEAERLRERMDEARRRPLSAMTGIAPGRAEELVAQIRADRDADPLPPG